MASESDDSDVEEYSGMEQPPLIQQLVTILDEYPDDGQIIKELIQNAEDAGATKMKILYDGRHLRPASAKEKKFDKFFKGPALVFWNNAEFTDDDWHGIRMIYSSVKANDPLKVGRFGLGFKSVFHITDYPVIVSGDRLMLMSPCERNPGMVCVTIQLQKLHKCEKLTMDHFLNALQDTFGFTADSMSSGRYSGTIFWFPLRERESDLSDTIYKEDEILDLLNSFQSDSDSMLLFLNNLQELAAYVRKADSSTSSSSDGIDVYDYGSDEPFFSVKLDKNVDEVVQKRKLFTSKIQNVHGFAERSVKSSTVLTFTTNLTRRDKCDVETKSRTWLVVKYLKGGVMPNRLKTLIQDKSLSYLPCVGVATPLPHSPSFKGHIFCYLPLPQEQQSLTGLPVHVNAFFALSQNRRHLKWPSADQVQYSMHQDKSIDWNLCLIQHVLPDAYLTLLQNAVEISGETHNLVYECIPTPEKVEDHWKPLLKELIYKVSKKKLLYTENNGGTWLSYKDALFIDTQAYISFGLQKWDSIEKFLVDEKQNVVRAPTHVVDALELAVDLKFATPAVLKDILAEPNSTYKQVSTMKKLHLLEFLLLDGDLRNVDGLELLLLQDGTFGTFSATETKYLASREQVTLFPGLEAMFVDLDVAATFQDQLRNMMSTGWYGLKRLELRSMVHMLQMCISRKFGTNTPVAVKSNKSGRFAVWVMNVWAYISNQIPSHVAEFRDLSIFPVMSTSDWNSMQEFHLHKLTDLMIIVEKSQVRRETNCTSIPQEVCTVLRMLSVVLVPAIPTWLRSDIVQPFIPGPSPENVCWLFGKLSPGDAEVFNRNTTTNQRMQLVKYVYRCTISAETRSMMQRLQIFKQMLNKTGDKQWVSLKENNEIVVSDTDFPIRYPRHYIVATAEEKQLAMSLGGHTVDQANLAIEVLNLIQVHSDRYSQHEIDTFMKWLLMQRFFETNQIIMNLLRNTCFLRTSDGHLQRPCDLFDPVESFLVQLFRHEPKFPADDCYQKGNMLHALKQLGLKTKHQISAHDIQQTAELLDKMAHEGQCGAAIKQKAKALMLFLDDNLHTLSTCNIKNMHCIPQQEERHPLFPPSLKWCSMPYSLCRPSEIKSNVYSVLIGSIQPVVDCRSLPRLANHFKWNDPPTESQIVSHFHNLVEQYDVSQKAEFVGSIHNIYKELSQRPVSKVQMEMTARFKGSADGHIWCGDGFLAPGQIYTESSKSDIELKPYLFLLPTELRKWKSLFLSLGCHQHQDADVLKNILEQINNCHHSGNTIQSAAKDLAVVINILNMLRDIADINDIETSDILFPIHMGTEARLVMKNSSLCSYSDVYRLSDVQSMDNDDDDDIVFVHGDVPHSTAEKLGVKSLTQQIMSDTEGLEEWGQTEPLTRRLHNLLKEGYVDGFSIPKELFQNADDAGAQKVCFLYDERENTDARTCLINESMADFQGPALWVYNDAEFSDEDFKNITKIGAGTKKNDSTKIGKFGLGFNAIYNLTDVPSLVSRANFIIFDPHMTYLGKALPGKSPGLKIDLQKMKNLKMMKRLQNQFKPFEGVFGCNLINNEPYFKGTLFRFPLRTYTQAKQSDICQIEYSRQECQKLLTLFLESAGNLMLFNQNVKDLRLYHIPATSVDPSNPDLIFSVGKTEFPIGNIPVGSEHILSTVASRKECKKLKEEPFQAIKGLQVEVSVGNQQLLPNISQCVNQVQWLVSWASGTEEKTLSLAFDNVGALPLGSVAVPVNKELLPMKLSDTKVGFYSKGHLYCFMPLPVADTGLPFHVNGCFAVSSDRRRLHHGTEDDKVVPLAKWNESLLQDAVCRSFVYLLDSLREVGVADQYLFHQLWPLVSEEFVQKFKDSFYLNAIHTSSQIFERNKVWFSFSQCMFIDQSLRRTHEVWDATFEIASHFLDAVTVVDVPQSIYDCLKKANITLVESKTLTQEQFFVNIFLPNVNSEYFHTGYQKQKRDMLILYALMLQNTVIDGSLSKSTCIPTLPDGTLRKPSFLVHGNGQIASLFSVSDGRFVESAFKEKSVQEQLVKLGMMKNDIHEHLISVRAHSVKTLASACGNCAMERCSKLMIYLQRVHAGGILSEEVLKNLKEIPFLPVMDKPEKWSLSWHAESTDCVINGNSISLQCSHSKLKDTALPLRLAVPESLFNSDCVSLVSTMKLVLDREKIDIHVKRRSVDPFSGLLKDLCISFKDNVPVELVIRQLQNISSEFTKCQTDKVPQAVNDVCTDLYFHLNMKCSGSAQISNVVSELKNDNIICFSDKFVCPNITAISVNNQCSPYLYSIRGHSLNTHFALCQSLQIKPHFKAAEICNVLVQMQAECQRISAERIHLLCNIIAELVYSMERDGITLDSLFHSCPNVYAPDVNGVLRNTTTMCFNDCEDIESSDDMIYIHDKVPPRHARILGVKTKRSKSLENTSEEIEFFQNEPLVIRLKGLLSGYPRDTGIFKELLQNADDAEATELHFIKDYGHHISVSEFGEPLQGPALCVYNNSSFTQEDLKGIQSLGTGSKSDDPSKTGQFGVGFNAVYNFTDSPSFLTKGPDIEHGETLCMFDPLAINNVPHTSREKPGRRFVNMRKLRIDHKGILDGYHEDIFENGYGTMFRFPLRTKESDISSNCWGKDDLDEILAEYRYELRESLLFLRNVRKITISNITTGKLESEYSVEVSSSEKGEAERRRYYEYQKQFIQQFKKDRMSVLKLACEEFAYEMDIRDIYGTNKWFVVQRVGYLKVRKVPEIVQMKYDSGELGLLPQGGVAVCLKKKTNEKGSKAFCFLPLPIDTGLPVHVNGHFALDHEARRSLWRGENIKNCHRTQWNISLLNLVVAPCYVTVLKYLKHHLFHIFGDNLHPEATLIGRLEEYEMFFPCIESANDVYWKCLSHSVYKQIVDGCEEILPSLQKTYRSEMDHTIDCRITWTSLNVHGYTFPAYFSNSKFISVSLLSTLQRIGLRIISNFEHIQEAMKKAKIKAETLSGVVVIDFLKSSTGSAKDMCRLDVEVPVKETVFNCVEMTEEVLKYCSKTKEFHVRLDLLPLLVTSDGILRQFSVQSPVYLTKYCTLFPDDGHKFVDKCLVSLLEHIQKVFEAGVFRQLNMSEFVRCLNGHSLKPRLSSGDFVDLVATADIAWIQQIWSFVYEEAEKCAEKKHELLPQFEKGVVSLGQWALVPISKHTQPSRIYGLFSVAKLHMLLDLDSFDHGTPIKVALESLDISSLETTCLNTRECQLLQKLTANRCDPVKVLTCLIANRSKLTNVSSAVCVVILKYFADTMKILNQSAEDWWVKENLTKLPLFIRKDGRATSLTGPTVLVIHEDIPISGVDDWAEKTGLILLQTCSELSSLYQYLGCKSTTVIDFYLQHLCSFSCHMTHSDLLKHVEFMSRKLIAKSFENTYSKQQEDLISLLRNLPFVTNSSGRKLKASELKNPKHEVFELFFEEDEFPDKEFQSNFWIEFLKCLGLQNHITHALYLRFAEEIESEGHRAITDMVCKKSMILIKHLFRETPEKLGGSSLQLLAKVKFVVPFRVDRKYSDLHPQMNHQSMQMICFAGSVIEAKEYLCWTTANILPRQAVPESYGNIPNKNWFYKHLGYRRQPTKDMIVLHCRNIGESLKQKLPCLIEKQNSLKWIEELMGTVYNCLMNEKIDDCTRQQLYNVPLVYYPNENEIYPAFQVILQCSDSELVRPYLLRAPIDYGQYFNFFTRLGASTTPLCHHYAQVLNQIKVDCGTKELHPNELVCVAKAARNLLKHLYEHKSEDIDLQVDHLYLPNEKHCMEASSAIVVSDNESLERRIRSGSSLNYFMGFESLAKILESCLYSQTAEDSGSTNTHSSRTVGDSWLMWSVSLFKRLKKKYHPLFLSEIVKEELDLTCLSTNITALSDNIETFLHSKDFIQGILRLIRDKLETNQCENGESAIISSFRNITVVQASGMKTCILLRNEKSEWELIPLSEKRNIFHCSQDGAGDRKLYFETDVIAPHLSCRLESEFVKCIDEVTGGRLTKHHLLVLNILKQMTKPDEINSFLDENGISQYGLRSQLSSMSSPKRGSYVPVKYHMFLDNEFCVFNTDTDEYVAYEQEDPFLDDENSASAPSYIYATIVSKSGYAEISPMLLFYKIDIGEKELITVPAYKLYKFLRKQNPERQVALTSVYNGDRTDGGPVQSHSADNLPLQHLYKQIRSQLTLAWTRSETERKHIIKRLYLKWHPDKNPGNEEYCTKVFQYIKRCIFKLEQGVKLEDSDGETDGFNEQANFTSSRYNAFFTNMNQRSREHRQFYEEEPHCSNDRSTGGDNYFYHNAEPEPYHYYEEADRWQRQAKSDCKNARMALVRNPSPAYNWVCYMCHQAAEKSLKAAWFSKDANKMRYKKKSNDLCDLAKGLERELLTLARQLSSETGNYTSMRYPDMHMMPQIPATAYSRGCAEQVCDIAEKIITLVSETYNGC